MTLKEPPKINDNASFEDLMEFAQWKKTLSQAGDVDKGGESISLKEEAEQVSKDDGFHYFSEEADSSDGTKDKAEETPVQPNTIDDEIIINPSLVSDVPVNTLKDNSSIKKDENPIEETVDQPKIEVASSPVLPQENKANELKIDLEKITKESQLVDFISKHNKLLSEIDILDKEVWVLGEQLGKSQSEILQTVASPDDPFLHPGTPPRVTNRLMGIRSKIAKSGGDLEAQQKSYTEKTAQIAQKRTEIKEVENEGEQILKDVLARTTDLWDLDKISLDIRQSVNDEHLSHSWPNLCTIRKIEIIRENKEKKNEPVDNLDLDENGDPVKPAAEESISSFLDTAGQEKPEIDVVQTVEPEPTAVPAKKPVIPSDEDKSTITSASDPAADIIKQLEEKPSLDDKEAITFDEDKNKPKINLRAAKEEPIEADSPPTKTNEPEVTPLDPKKFHEWVTVDQKGGAVENDTHFDEESLDKPGKSIKSSLLDGEHSEKQKFENKIEAIKARLQENALTEKTATSKEEAPLVEPKALVDKDSTDEKIVFNDLNPSSASQKKEGTDDKDDANSSSQIEETAVPKPAMTEPAVKDNQDDAEQIPINITPVPAPEIVSTEPASAPRPIEQISGNEIIEKKPTEPIKAKEAVARVPNISPVVPVLEDSKQKPSPTAEIPKKHNRGWFINLFKKLEKDPEILANEALKIDKDVKTARAEAVKGDKEKAELPDKT